MNIKSDIKQLPVRTDTCQVVLGGNEGACRAATHAFPLGEDKAWQTTGALQLVDSRRNAEARNLARSALSPAGCQSTVSIDDRR